MFFGLTAFQWKHSTYNQHFVEHQGNTLEFPAKQATSNKNVTHCSFIRYVPSRSRVRKDRRTLKERQELRERI